MFLLSSRLSSNAAMKGVSEPVLTRHTSMKDFLPDSLVWTVEVDGVPFITTQIKLKTGSWFLESQFPYMKKALIKYLLPLPCSTILSPFWEASNIHELLWRIFRPGNIIIDSSVCKFCIRSVRYLGFIISIIWAWSYPTVDVYEASSQVTM